MIGETNGQKVIRFVEQLCPVPEGQHVGKPIVLADFQKKFILDIYDNPHGTRKAILSIARKNGKTALLAGLILAHVVGPMRKQNTQVVSGAMSRDQAALVYNLAAKMLDLQPKFAGLYKSIPSSKRIVGLKSNVEYRALAADGSTAHGLSPVFALLDEVGQVKGPMTPFIEAIMTSQGAHESPLLMAISTQAASDADLLSLFIDDSRRSNDPHTVCHVYEADPDCDLMDNTQWAKANPALGIFRSEKDLEEQLKLASRIPSMESSVRNLLLNQRVSLESTWIGPTLWKENASEPDYSLLNSKPLHIGLDLSKTDDLTAAVGAIFDDEGFVHVYPWVFTPVATVDARAKRDRAPYVEWIKQGLMVGVPGKTIDYEWVAQFMAQELNSAKICSINFDRWRIEELKRISDNVGFGNDANWIEVGQGYQSFSPRLEKVMELLLQGKIKHGGHPLLNFGAANAIAVADPAGNLKLDKAKSTQKIDMIVAMVMAVYAAFSYEDQAVDIDSWIV